MNNPTSLPFNLWNVVASTDKVAATDLGKIYEINGRVFQVVKAHADIKSTEVRAGLVDGATLSGGGVICTGIASQSLAFDTTLNNGEDYRARLVQGTTVLGTGLLTGAASNTLEDLVAALKTALDAGDTGIDVVFDTDGVQIDLASADDAYKGNAGRGIFLRLENIEDPEAILTAVSASTAGGADARVSDPAGLVTIWQSRTAFTVNVTTSNTNDIAGFVPAEITQAIAAGQYFLLQLPRNGVPLTARVAKTTAGGDAGKAIITGGVAGLVTFESSTAETTATAGRVAGTAADVGDTLAIVTI